MSIALDVRAFFTDLFGSSLVARLEDDLLRLRQDFEERLLDKERRITELVQEKAALQSKVLSYEFALLPTASKAGADYVRQQVKPDKPSFLGMDFSSPAPVSRW